MVHFYYVDVKKVMEDYRNIDIKNVNHDSSFAPIESGILHFKNRISVEDIFTKRGKSRILNFTNRIGVEDIFTKRGESGKVDYSFRGSKP